MPFRAVSTAKGLGKRMAAASLPVSSRRRTPVNGISDRGTKKSLTQGTVIHRAVRITRSGLTVSTGRSPPTLAGHSGQKCRTVSRYRATVRRKSRARSYCSAPNCSASPPRPVNGMWISILHPKDRQRSHMQKSSAPGELANARTTSASTGMGCAEISAQKASVSLMVFSWAVGAWCGLWRPQLHTVEERHLLVLECRPAGGQFVRAEDDRIHEHSFESVHQPAIVLPVSRETEFSEDLVAGLQRELAAAKANRLCRHPD